MKTIQVSISSFSGTPATILGVLADGVLSVAKIVEHSNARLTVKGDPIELFVADDTSSDADTLFRQSDIQAAIEAYFRLKNGMSEDGSPRMVILDDVRRRSNPDAVLQVDKLTERGLSYQLADGMKNEHMAVLAMALSAEKSASIDAQFEMISTVDRLLSGCLVTI